MAAEPPLKVLQVASSLSAWGGIERYVLYLADGLRASGHQVDISCPAGGELAHRAGKSIPVQTRNKFDLAAFRSYLKLFRQNRYDIVHLHFNPDFRVAAVAARMRGQGARILTRHVALPWSAAKVRAYSPLFDHIIPVSDAVRQKLIDSGIDPAKLTVAKAGCPALQSTASVPDPFTVGIFGRYAPEKGLAMVLEAARTLPDVDFRLYGSGPMEGWLRENSPANVHIEGFVGDVADRMASCHVIAIPSVWDEAFPYAALEAMSLGRPLVVSRVGGLPEIVQEGINGLAFDRENVAGFADQIHILSRDLALVRRLGEAGRCLHRAQYTVEAMTERIVEVYRAVQAT